MDNNFVDLNRKFVTIPREYSFNEEEFDLPFAFSLLESTGWDSLLQLPRAIILAKAGAGKTEELQAVTHRLRNGGKKAFFFRLEHLDQDFETSFEIGTILEFEEWIISSEPGWFFLDSVDEARLHSSHRFEAAIRKFGNKIGDHKQRAHIFITSRVSEWRAQADLDLIKRKIPFNNPIQTRQEEDKYKPNDLKGSSTGTISVNTKVEPTLLDPAVFALCPLDKDQRKVFSHAFDVQDVETFLLAIEKAEAETFASWPQDLIELIDYWKKNKKIANHAKLIKNSILTQLIERDPERASELPLNIEEARHGAEMLAAAATLLRKSRILVPEQNPDPFRKTDSIDVRSVLKDWSEKQIRALLQRPIFDRAIYGCVRFHHRNVREYLTAHWLNRLLQNGKSRRSIEDLFFKERYGCQVLVPSMRPVLSWLILLDDNIRERVTKTAPETFLQGGDSSEIPIDYRKRILEKLCSQYAHQKRWEFSFDISELRRFTHPDLGQTINALLEIYRDHEEIRGLLLRMIWKGEIQSCTEMALSFVLDAANDASTRIYALRAVGAAGTGDQKRRLIDVILTDSTCKDRELIGECIAAFASEILCIRDVLKLIERVERPEEYSYTSLEGNLKQYSLEGCPEREILKWCEGLLLLLKQPPVMERRDFEVSQKHSWLLPFATLAVERLVRIKHHDALDPSALEIISFTQTADRYHYYYTKDHKLAELVPQWPELNHALFWFIVTITRQQLNLQNQGRLIDFGQAYVHNHYWRFTKEDFGKILTDIFTKPEMDDQLVALSLAFQLYQELGRGRIRRQALKKAVRGVPALEERLSIFLKPSPKSEESKQIRHSNISAKQRQRKHKQRDAKNRQKWLEWLKANTDILRDTSTAVNGSIWNATYYLLRELRVKEGNSSYNNKYNWENLIPEFGQDVAEAFRDGCINYWRKYRPKLRSEGLENPNSIPYAVAIGLLGLTIEARHIPEWPSNLTEGEASLACRYAIFEMNKFPDWLQKLHAFFPNTVETVLLDEIAWEFSAYDGNDHCHYVLSKVTYQSDWLKPKIGYRIMMYLRDYEPKHDNTIDKALEIVLSCSGLDQMEFAKISKTKVERTASPTRRVMWLVAWMCVEAKSSFEMLKSILANIPESAEATEFSMMLLTSLLEDGRVDVRREYKDFTQPEMLLSLIKLMHNHIRISEDIDRVGQGVFTPGLRDNAQRARDRLSQLLRDIPGKDTYLAMVNLSQEATDERMREWYDTCAKRRAEADSEADPWLPEGISQFAEEAERAPQNHRELYELSISRLLDLKAELEDGDTSLAIILQSITDETKHRLAVGDWLRRSSRGRYSVPQEEELADGTKPDLRIHGCGFDGPVPIELKIVNNGWTAVSLIDRIDKQLCDQYLRDIRSNCGIFLLISIGKKNWIHPKSGENLPFYELVQYLKEAAKKVIDSKTKVEAIEIIDIDLTIRNAKKLSSKAAKSL